MPLSRHSAAPQLSRAVHSIAGVTDPAPSQCGDWRRLLDARLIGRVAGLSLATPATLAAGEAAFGLRPRREIAR